MLWSDLEPSRGVIDAAKLDVYRQSAISMSASGARVIWVVLGAPAWASATGRPGGPPADPDQFGAFLRYVAARMAGTVGAYEIWNEPDDVVFWRAAPNAHLYARVLRAAYGAVKVADPRAKVVFGGLTGNDYAFLRAAYAAGAGPYFDAVAVHTDIPCELRDPRYFVRDPGGRISRWSFLGYRSVRAEMLAHRDGRPIWMTELGWSASLDPCTLGVWAGTKAAGVPEPMQAAYLTDAYACLARDRYVTVALWFNLADSPVNEAEGVRYGLLRVDGTRRAAWTAFNRVVALNGAVSGRCHPHYVGPRVGLRLWRRRDRRVVASIEIRADLRVTGLRVRLDHRTVDFQSEPPARVTVVLPAVAGRGRHVVKATAVDVARNVGSVVALLGRGVSR